ncbi:MAG: serine/threonine protein kinase, partial [Candidatus Promineifilaceae bacterium]
RQVSLNRLVAVKLIHSHLSSDPQFVHRFKDEAAAVASLRHPHIIRIFDFDEDDDVYFIVFEFIPGESLQEYQARAVSAGRAIPLELVVEQGANVADALAYAHDRGIIHRDIKPANVMLNVQNEAILMDFGLVKITGGDSHTATGAVMGTARYMSPEQIRGERVDERTDIYSLGVMLYEMAAGKPPFQADSALTLMMMHINDPVPNLQNMRRDVPASLVQVIERALVKDRNHRYQTAAEFAAALRGVKLGGTAIAAGAAATAAGAKMTTSRPNTAPQPVSKPQNAQPAPVAYASPSTPPKGTIPPVPPPAPAPAAGGSSKRNIGIAAVAGVVLLLLLCIGGAAVVFGTGLLSGDGKQDGTTSPEAVAAVETSSAGEDTESSEANASRTAAASGADSEGAITKTSEPTAQPTATLRPTLTPTDEPTAEPTDEPTASPTTYIPTPTSPPPTPTTAVGPYVYINGISVSNGQYIVDYSTSGYTPSLPDGEHIHFFFDTVRPEDAGLPGSGPWLIYAGPVPFSLYSVTSRPPGATSMCALVANVDHSIKLGTGNCYVLP